MNNTEVFYLTRLATRKGTLTPEDMERLGKELLSRFSSRGLDTQPERIVLAAYISCTDHAERLYYINERMAEWTRKVHKAVS